MIFIFILDFSHQCHHHHKILSQLMWEKEDPNQVGTNSQTGFGKYFLNYPFLVWGSTSKSRFVVRILTSTINTYVIMSHTGKKIFNMVRSKKHSLRIIANLFLTLETFTNFVATEMTEPKVKSKTIKFTLKNVKFRIIISL